MPTEIAKDVYCLVKGYRADITKQKKIWEPVRVSVKKWQDFHAARKKGSEHLLSYRDGGNFLIIRQELQDGRIYHHRLRGLSRDIYLACCQINTVSDLLARFPQLNEDKILQFIESLVKKKIMFRQQDKILSLAVSSRS